MRLFMRLDQRRRLGAGATLCLLLTLLTGVGGAPAQGDPKRVLLLYDEDTRLPGLSILDRTLRSHFSAALGSNIEFFTESMNVSQFNGEHDEEVLSEYYSKKYRDKKPDLIMAVMGPALHFLLRHGDEAFPAVPIVFCGADAADIQGVTLPDRATGILVRRVFAPTIDVVLRLQPDTHRIVVVGGTSAFDRHLMAQARSEFQQFEQRVAFEYLIDLPMADLLAAVSVCRRKQRWSSSRSSGTAKDGHMSRMTWYRRSQLPPMFRSMFSWISIWVAAPWVVICIVSNDTARVLPRSVSGFYKAMLRRVFRFVSGRPHRIRSTRARLPVGISTNVDCRRIASSRIVSQISLTDTNPTWWAARRC